MSDPIAALVDLLGNASVETREVELRFASQDLFFEGVLPLAIVSPSSTKQVANLMNWCQANGVAVCPRGGGMSYTAAFQPQAAHSITLDFKNLSSIRHINPEDGEVTVETGCTWAALDSALAHHGMRARFWGPMSGRTATIGGSLSQGSVTFGSGQVGASANAVKSFEIVTGGGEVLLTGSDASTDTSPFNRNYGPDLTGIFANDAGALGIKTAATLEIEPRPQMVNGLSFAFDNFDQLSDMLREVRLRRLASELLGMDAEVARQNAGPPNIVQDAKAAWRVGLAAGSVTGAIGRVARIAMAGRRFIDKAAYTVHFMVEARDRYEMRSRLKAIRKLAIGGSEITNTVPLATRANPFPELPVMHPDGRRMLPIHGVFADSRIKEFHRDYLAFKESRKEKMDAHGVTLAEFFAGIAGIGTLYEPVFYWPDSQMLYHKRRNPAYLDGVTKQYPPNDEGRELVRDLVDEIVQLMRSHGSTHFQIGRLYPYSEARTGEAGALLKDLKQHLDPQGILNPGALGL